MLLIFRKISYNFCMTLTAHIVIAAAVAKPLAAYHPAFAFLTALASHYLSDAIPHWDYKILSISKNHDEPDRDAIRWPFGTKIFWKDLARFATDAFLGAGILYIFLRPKSLEDFLFFAAIVSGSVLPDFLQGLYFTRYFNFLRPLQRFHDKIHTKIKLGPYPLIGVPFQAALFFAAIFFLL